jgi:DNA-binding GntR family transcriptional regulator
MNDTQRAGSIVDLDVRTTAGVVYRGLQRDVLTGWFDAGAHLNERELTDRYGVSRTPLREALKELVRQGLAVAVPYRGVFVKEVSLDFARDVYEMRSGLDGIAGYHAATRATRHELDVLQGVFQRIEERSEPVADEVGQRERRDDILLLNSEFHRRVAAAAHNELLLAKHDELWVSISLVRSRVWKTDVRTRSSLEEHAELLDALSRRQPLRARTLFEAHAMRAWNFVADAFAARSRG